MPVTQPRVLHFSADFPDPLVPAKTPVIARLLDLSSDHFDHRVISLNRRTPSKSAMATGLLGRRPLLGADGLQPFEHGHYLTYHAPPGGLLHRTSLLRLADEIADKMESWPRPALLFGHKLTIEGLVVQRLAEKWGIPYAITIQGNTDTKILKFRPDLAPKFREVLTGAAHVFCFAPWARERIAGQTGFDASQIEIMPCPTKADTVMTPRTGGDGLLSVFHLRNYKGKNLALLIDAMRQLRSRGIATPLQVVGGGSPEEVAACEELARGVAGVAFPGPRQQPELSAMMNRATAFVMPSRRESFGLVFSEALFAGLPIIYPKGTSVDGYFDELPFAIAVDASEPSAVANAMAHAIENEATLKSALEKWQADGGLERFTQSSIGAQFTAGLHRAISV